MSVQLNFDARDVKLAFLFEDEKIGKKKWIILEVKCLNISNNKMTYARKIERPICQVVLLSRTTFLYTFCFESLQKSVINRQFWI